MTLYVERVLTVYPLPDMKPPCTHTHRLIEAVVQGPDAAVLAAAPVLWRSVWRSRYGTYPPGHAWYGYRWEEVYTTGAIPTPVADLGKWTTHRSPYSGC